MSVLGYGKRSNCHEEHYQEIVRVTDVPDDWWGAILPGALERLLMHVVP
jgi:hypothetical protein